MTVEERSGEARPLGGINVRVEFKDRIACFSTARTSATP